MAAGFTKVFGGGPVQPSNQLYVQLQLAAANTPLAWPIESSQNAIAIGDLMDITQTGGALTMQLPDATQGSEGLTSFINNLGLFSFNVIDSVGNVVLTSAPGTVWMIYLADNTTAAGVWRAYQFGAQSSSVNVAALAGAGLQVVNQALAQAMPNTTIATSYASSILDLATTFIWNGGTGTFALPDVGSVNASWFIKIVNAGSGVLTVAPPTGLIDSGASKAFAVGGSGFVFNDGTNYWSLGYGLSGSGTGFGYINVNLPATGTYTLSGAQLNQISYLLTGALTGNVTLVVPASVQQYWINNQTTGGFLVHVVSAGAGTAVDVAQGSQVILYCDGTNIISAVTGTSLPILVSQGGTGATTAGTARTNLGISSVGNAIVTAASTGAAQTAMGAGVAGAAVFVSANNVAAWAAIMAATPVANGLYLPGASTVGLRAGSTLIFQSTSTFATVSVPTLFNSASPSVATITATTAGGQPGLSIAPVGAFPGIIELFDGNTGNRIWRVRDGAVANGTLDIFDATAGRTALSASITGQLQGYEPSYGIAALRNLATISASQFTGTLTGTTTNPQAAVTYVRDGNMVALSLPAITGPSNSTTMTITGAPASIVPATGTYLSPMLAGLSSNAQAYNIQAQMSPTGVLVFVISATSAGFVNDGLTKGLNLSGQVFVYFLT